MDKKKSKTTAAGSGKKPLTISEAPSKIDNTIKDPAVRRAMDAFQNLAARLGVGSTNLLEGTRYPLTRISNNYILMQSLYRSNWIAQRVADTYPEEMCKIPPKLTCQVKPQDIAKFNRVIDKTGTWRKLEWTMKLGNIFGGAGAVIVIKGHENFLDTPLDYDDIRPDTFRGLIPFDRWSGITPSASISNDIDKPNDYCLPESYRVTTQKGSGFDVHASRVLRFTGRDLPLWEQQSMMYWGESLFESVYEELVKRDNSSFNIVSLMFRAQIMGLKIPELGPMLSGLNGNTAQLENFMRVLNAQSALMSNQGLAVFGKDGGMESHQYTFGGIADVWREFMKDIAAAAEIPFEILFGRDAGLGDSGEGSLQVFYDRVAHKQSSKLTPALEKLYPVVAMSTWGEIPEDFAWVYPIARTVSNEDRAELADKLTKPVLEAFNAGVIGRKTTLMELRQSAEETQLFSNITDEMIEQASDDPEPQGEMGGEGPGGGLFGKGGDPEAKEPKDPEAKEPREPKAADPKARDSYPSQIDPYSAPLSSVQGMRKYHNLDVVIETAKGQRRRGAWWRSTMPADYGYITGTKGADGDEVDCYVGPNPESPFVFIVDQNKLESTRFDEHKVMLGYWSLEAAKQAYFAGHTSGREIFRSITPMPMLEFKNWLSKGERKRPMGTTDAMQATDSCSACESGDCVMHAHDSWNESEHPRKAAGPGGGQFTSKGGSSEGQKKMRAAASQNPNPLPVPDLSR